MCLASGLAAFGAATPGQELLFQFFSQPNSSTLFSGYIDSGNLATPLISGNGPAGIAAIIPSPLTGRLLSDRRIERDFYSGFGLDIN